jgi:hypothetical protein
MTNWGFTPQSQEQADIFVPFIEDARKDFAPHYRSGATIAQAEARVIDELDKLHASVVAFERGLFRVGEHDRHGYRIRFTLDGAPGMIRVAGLPMRAASTKTKETQVRVQCLLNVADWLKAAVTQQVFSPDASPLVPFLLMTGSDGQEITVAELVTRQRQLPAPVVPTITVSKVEDTP